MKEREGRLREAEQSVADSFATSQAIVGPVLQRSCVEQWQVTETEGTSRTQPGPPQLHAVRRAEMIVTRKLDWYSLFGEMRASKPAPPPVSKA